MRARREVARMDPKMCDMPLRAYGAHQHCLHNVAINHLWTKDVMYHRLMIVQSSCNVTMWSLRLILDSRLKSCVQPICHVSMWDRVFKICTMIVRWQNELADKGGSTGQGRLKKVREPREKQQVQCGRALWFGKYVERIAWCRSVGEDRVIWK